MVTSDVQKAFGVDLRAARVAAGMTLAQLAKAAFDNPDRKGYVSQIEKGNRKINSLTVGKLAEALDLPDSVTRPMMANDDLPSDETPTPEDEKAAKMIAAAETEGAQGVGESLLVALAYEYAEGDAANLQSAYKGLRAALQTAREMAAQSELKDNTDASVAAIRARVDALNKDGEPDAAAEVIDDAIAQKTAEMAALLNLGVQQDRLRNDPKAAADKLVMGLRLEVAEDALFEALRDLQDDWYQKGQVEGLNFESAVAIDLARATLDMARSSDERGAAGNSVGLALGVLGERESNSAKLTSAVDAFRQALVERTRDRVPIKWAMTQMNLGNALKFLGKRTGNTDSLREAVEAYEAALEELTQATLPKEWARTLMNLGVVLVALCEHDDGNEKLEKAIDLYGMVFQEWTQKKYPREWAIAQINLGIALKQLGERESDTTLFDQSIAAFHVAQEEITREKIPLDWAQIQLNLGNVLRAYGKLTHDTDKLDQALVAYELCLEERTRDRVPLQWATTHLNLASLALTCFNLTNDAAQLDKAESYASAARDVYLAANATYYLARADHVLAETQERRPDKR